MYKKDTLKVKLTLQNLAEKLKMDEDRVFTSMLKDKELAIWAKTAERINSALKVVYEVRLTKAE